MNEKKLYIVDGYAFAYRAYYALIRSPLISSKGFPTGAVYGFANYILRLIETCGCPYLAVAMDSAVPTFRHTAYAQYKANREAMPDDLKQQIPRIFELLDAFNIPVVKKDGFEADDVVASLTKRALADEFEVFLVTKDKDLMQLVGPNVTMLAPDGSGVFSPMGPRDVFDKMGVPPEKVLDYLALVGDPSDNIPGVSGIGSKGAIKILETLTVEQILKDPASGIESTKYANKIREHLDDLALSKMLVTLRDDVEFDLSLDDLKRGKFDVSRCRALLTELEFFSMLRNPLFGARKKFEPVTRTVDSIAQLRALIETIGKRGEVSIDAAAAGNHHRVARLRGITLAVDPSEAFYVRIDCDDRREANPGTDSAAIGLFDALDGHDAVDKSDSAAMRKSLDRSEALKILAGALESPQIGKIGYDLKRLSVTLRSEGITLRGLAFDAMLAAYVIDPGKRRYDLAELAGEHLGVDIKTAGDWRDSGGFIDPLDNHAPSADAACAALLLREKLLPVMDERGCANLFRDIELSLESVLAEMEWNGVLIDTELLSRLSSEYAAEIERITQNIHAFAGVEFNLNSPKQLGEVLFGKLGLHGGKKTKGGSRSTSVEVLESLAADHPIVMSILDYREKQKLLSTYIDALPAQILPQTGRVHTSFNQAITATGRLSSTNPNLQNIPIRTENGRKIRAAFIAPPDCLLVSADYSQIELRILAHLSGDPSLVQAFTDDKDVHAQTASAIYGARPDIVTPEMRRAAKTINFGLMYGMGPINLSKQLGISFAEAKKFIESYFNRFPSIRAFMDAAIQKTHERGYSETIFGRKRYLPEINSTNRTVMEAAERTAINTPVQGTAADIIKVAMIKLYRKMPEMWPRSKMLLQVHDELIFETPAENAEEFAQWAKEEMSGACELKVPLKVDAGVGRHWGEAH
ncbi:MAG: DNA polymerase I [Chitinispirillales bacterium]|jgi:DNA polymerase-1|nr:DNA polymerase I [Chitinispirillales bacterium]